MIVNRGVIKICYNIPIWGGGASLGNPNLYYIIYGRPLMCDGSYLMSASHNPFGIRYLFVSLFWVNVTHFWRGSCNSNMLKSTYSLGRNSKTKRNIMMGHKGEMTCNIGGTNAFFYKKMVAGHFLPCFCRPKSGEGSPFLKCVVSIWALP